jgi:hypothetical protein
MASAKQTMAAATATVSATSDTPQSDLTFYTLHVDAGTQEILTKAEARRAERAAQRAETLGNIQHNRVVSEPAGIDCPGVCDAAFAKGTRVTLRYEENLDHQFVEWTGSACFKRRNGQPTRGRTCLIEKMDEDKRVGAVFKIGLN